MRVLVASLLAAAAALVLGAGPAFARGADDPVDLAGAYVLDTSGVLGARTGEVSDALDRLYTETGAKVFIVYVDRFENPSDALDWADSSAELSGLGPADLLLAIATADREYAYSAGTAFPVSDGDIEKVVNDDLIPQLRDSAWADAGVAFADGLVAVQAPSPVPGIVGGVAAAAVGTGVVVAVTRARLRKRKAARAAEAEADALDQRAGTILVQLDDALKTSEQELGFAEAQFGAAQVKDFAAALARATELAQQAFELQQKLDDAFPETAQQHRAMTEQLIQLASQADEVLDAQTAAFDELRQLEKNAASVLDDVATRQKGLDARIEQAATTIAALRKTYPEGDLSSLAGLPAQARKLDTFARTTVREARNALTAAAGSEQAGVAVAVRAAQQAVGQVEQLLAGVDRTKGDLEAKAQRTAAEAAALQTQLRDAQSRVSEANDYISTHRGAVGTAARTRASEAARHLDQATAASAADSATALREATEAERLGAVALDLAMADVENAESVISGPQNPDPFRRDDGFDGAFIGGILGGLFGDGGSSSSSSSGGWWGGGSSGWSGSGWGGGSSHHSSGGSIFGGFSGGHAGGHSGGSRGGSRRGGHGRF
ncbi:MAG TPA: TPM domain-containing protein [Pseudolysinimonas sp.]|nr:TPM domain-containing protein [Pseudolysinimonas sp.]